MRIQSGVKTVLFNQSGEVLLIKRSASDDRRPGEWDMPGGGVDAGEDFAQAAAREVEEETGIKIDPSQLRALYLGTMDYRDRDLSVNRALFAATLNGDISRVALSAEHDELKWVSVEQAIQEFPHPFYNTGLRYALEHGLI